MPSCNRRQLLCSFVVDIMAAMQFCWSKELLQGLMVIIDSSQDWRAQMLRKQRIIPTRITQLSQEKFIAKLSDYRHDPTNPECTTRTHCVYSQWMFGDAVEQHGYTMPAYLRAGCHKHMKRALTRLRLSNAHITLHYCAVLVA
jgi:hypothetical protein